MLGWVPRVHLSVAWPGPGSTIGRWILEDAEPKGVPRRDATIAPVQLRPKAGTPPRWRARKRSRPDEGLPRYDWHGLWIDRCGACLAHLGRGSTPCDGGAVRPSDRRFRDSEFLGLDPARPLETLLRRISAATAGGHVENFEPAPTSGRGRQW